MSGRSSQGGGGLMSTSGENYLLSLQAEQKKKKSEEHGVERRIQHMIYGGMVLALLWVVLAVRQQREIDDQIQAAAAGAQVERDLEDSFDGFVGDFIHPSLAEEVKKNKAATGANATDTSSGSRLNFGGLLKFTAGWVSLILIVAAGVLKIKEGNNQPDSGNFSFPPLPSASAQQAASVNGQQQKQKGRYGTPRRGTAGDIKPLGVDMKAGNQNTNIIQLAVPPRSSLGGGAFGSSGGGGGRSSGALGRVSSVGGGGGADGDLGRLLEDDRRFLIDQSAAVGHGGDHNGGAGQGAAGLGGFPAGVRPVLDGGRGFGHSSESKNRGMHVNFGSSARRRDETSKQAADSDGWKALGVKNPELATLRVAEWINRKILQEVAKEIDECNKFWQENGFAAFDCSNSLQDMFEVHDANVSSAPSGGRPVISKQKALQNEKDKLLNQNHRIQNGKGTYEDIVQVDKRLKLEELLRVDKMFGFGKDQKASTTTSAYESPASRRQAYIIRRIRSLASQPTLSGYNPSGGEPEVWCEDYPTDAYLLSHLLMQHIPCFARHVKHPQQPMTEKRDLAIYVGSTGDPYFYVKYRNPPAVTEKIFHTKQGNESIFQAILIFSAIIAKYHDSAYGSVFGVVELKDLDLDQVVRS